MMRLLFALILGCTLACAGEKEFESTTTPFNMSSVGEMIDFLPNGGTLTDQQRRDVMDVSADVVTLSSLTTGTAGFILNLAAAGVKVLTWVLPAALADYMQPDEFIVGTSTLMFCSFAIAGGGLLYKQLATQKPRKKRE